MTDETETKVKTEEAEIETHEMRPRRDQDQDLGQGQDRRDLESLLGDRWRASRMLKRNMRDFLPEDRRNPLRSEEASVGDASGGEARG